MITETITIDTTTLIIGTLVLIGAYLFGSLSSAIIYCKLFNLPDPRTAGSRNPGATNVLRIGGKTAAISVLFFDILKGAIPVFLAELLVLGPWFVGLTACAVVIGHLFPIFFRFEGGKGVATAGGACLAISWPFGLAVIAIWLFVVFLTRTSSLGALAASGAAPILAYIMVNWQIGVMMIIITFIVVIKHRGNIQRLRSGTEPKVNSSLNSD